MPTKLSIPTEDEIRARAYQIYLARNGEHGHAADDWLQAEYELMHLPLHKVAQLDGAAIEKQTTRHLRLIDLAHAVSMFKKPSSRQIHSLWSRPAISSTAVAT